MNRGLIAALCLTTAACAGPVSNVDHVPTQTPVSPVRQSFDPDRPRRGLPGLLPFFYDVYTFRGDTGTTRVVASFAVPARRLKAEEVDGEYRYRFDVTLVLADTLLGTVSRTDDSVYVASPRPVRGDHLLYTHIEVPAPPSSSTVYRVIMTDATNPGVGQLYDSGFAIPDYGGTALMLSDIALGEPDEEGGWTRDDVTLALLPTSQFPESAFDVFFEIYNLRAGSRYETEITVARLDGGRGGPVGAHGAIRLRFSGESAARADDSVQELRRVEAPFARGRYRLTVTITDLETGRSASRSRRFQVRGWSHGTTLVPAHPWWKPGRESPGPAAGAAARARVGQTPSPVPRTPVVRESRAHVLVFSRTAGYRHASIEPGIAAIRALGEEDGFAVDATEDASAFEPGNLRQYDAIVFLSTTLDVLNEEQEAAFMDYIRQGGGFVGIHAASDTEYDWPWYGGLVGGYFASHPNNPNVREGVLLVADSTHPSTEMLPARWVREDEWYDIRDLAPGLNVLLNVDETSYKRPDERPAPEPRPIAWYHEYDGGRSWYTALGHTSESFSEPLFLDHVRGGLRFAIGQD